MEKDFWAARWHGGQIGFHGAVPNVRLVAHVTSLGSKGSVLVPLCGKSLDMTFLAARGFDVVGVEFVGDAALDYFAEAGVTPQRLERDGFVVYQHQNVTIWVADILAIPAQTLGHVDAIYDRAALVALPETTRAAYAQKLASVSHAGTRLLLITFEHDLLDGPPFSIDGNAVQTMFGLTFAPAEVERLSTLDESPRWKERGATQLSEVVWTGIRL